MVNQNDILKALQEGQDAGALAQQFADALNGAIAQKNKSDEMARQKAAEQRQNAVRKESMLQGIIDDMLDFIDEFYPDFKVPGEMEKELTADKLIEAMDAAAAQVNELMSSIKDLEAITGNINESDSIAAFLKAQGLA